MAIRTTLILVHILLVFGINPSVTGHISFSEYCLNDSNPEVLPESGKNSGGILSMNSLDSKVWYKPGMNCSVTLSVPAGYQLLIAFSRISLRNSSMDSLVVLSDDATKHSSLSGDQKCPNENCPELKFESGQLVHNMTFHFDSANITVPLNYSGFKAAYTVFDMTIGKSGRCRDGRFLCQNAHCIAIELVCDGHNNCGDRSDESICSIPAKDTVWGIVAISIAVVSIILLVPLFCFLASYGTRSIVKSVTVPSHAVPLYSAVNDNESANLLTSSGAPYNEFWGSRSFERRDTFTYGTTAVLDDQPSTSKASQRSQSCSGLGNGRGIRS